MEKFCGIGKLAALLLLGFSITAAGQNKSETWIGWISDSGCAAKGMSAEHKGCAVACVHNNGAKWVFVSSDSKQVYTLHNQDAVTDKDVGMEVKLTGSAEKDGSIHIDTIAPAS